MDLPYEMKHVKWLIVIISYQTNFHQIELKSVFGGNFDAFIRKTQKGDTQQRYTTRIPTHAQTRDAVVYG